jgi:hypothetical protein
MNLINDEINYYENKYNEINNIIQNKECILKNINDIKIGDYIYITFI